MPDKAKAGGLIVHNKDIKLLYGMGDYPVAISFLKPKISLSIEEIEILKKICRSDYFNQSLK